VNSVPLEDCNSRQAAEVRPLEDTQLCAAGNSGEDACKGDSGGPLMDVVQLPTRRTAQTFQMGIVSFGSIPCGAQTSPSVYTRVSAYLEWILDHIAE
jgi:secreted trypsin-like serine protease